MLKIGDKKLINAWAFYDWANSVYPLVISSAIFPIFYEGYVDEKVIFFGFEFINTALITLLSSCYFLILVFILPISKAISGFLTISIDIKSSFFLIFCLENNK